MELARPGAHFTWQELCRTGTGLPNEPTAEQARRLVVLCGAVLDSIRRALGPVAVTSGFRSAAVNAAVHGSSTSQHMAGEAADIKVSGLSGDGVSGEALLLAILATSGLHFDQVIAYASERGGHVHVSYACDRAQRGEILFAPKSGGYVPWKAP